jgi:hypothetical protein
MRTLLDLRGVIPSFIHIGDGKLHDVNVLDILIPAAGAFYIMDRGYIDFGRLYALLIFSQSPQVNFSRKCWITFYWSGIDSSVSVTSSPSLRSRPPPQQRQAVGPGTITRSRGRCAGNGLREGFLRVNGRTGIVSPAEDAACSAAISSSVAAVSNSSSCSSS